MQRVVLVARDDWAIYNYRSSLASYLTSHECEVIALCADTGYTEHLKNMGVTTVPWSISDNPLSLIGQPISAISVARQLKRLKPDLVHSFGVRAILQASIACRIAGITSVSTFTGLGYLFNSHGLKARLIRRLVVTGLKFGLKRTARIITQTTEHRDFLVGSGIADDDQISVIPGNGIDTEKFKPRAQESNASPDDLKLPVFLMAGRLLYDKGIEEFVTAAAELKSENVDARFVVAGDPFPGNPAFVPESVISRWKSEGNVEFLGHVDGMNELLQSVDAAVLPSYHEGVSRFLIEAAASGLPIVTTDLVGSREVVQHEKNGYLVDVKDSDGLRDAMRSLAEDADLRIRMGQESRRVVEARLSDEIVIKEIIDVYRDAGFNLP